MWGCDQHSDRGNNCEQGEGDQAQSIEDHGSKFPVIFYSCCLIVIPDLVRDDANLLENTQKFSVHPRMNKVFLVMRRIYSNSEKIELENLSLSTFIFYKCSNSYFFLFKIEKCTISRKNKNRTHKFELYMDLVMKCMYGLAARPEYIEINGHKIAGR